MEKHDLYKHMEKKVTELEEGVKELRERIKTDIGVTDEDIDKYLKEDLSRPKIKTRRPNKYKKP